MEYVSPSSRVETAPPIQVITIELEKQITELNEIAAALESRLTPVLREPEPSGQKDIAGVSPTQSSFASMLNQRLFEIKSITNRLSAIMRRLEI